MTSKKVYVVEGIYRYSDGSWIQSIHETEEGAKKTRDRLDAIEEDMYGEDGDMICSYREYDLEP